MDTLLQDNQSALKTIVYLLREAGVRELPNFCTYEQSALKIALRKCEEQILKNIGIK